MTFIKTLGLSIRSSRPLLHFSNVLRAHIFGHFEVSLRLYLDSPEHHGPAFRDPTGPILSLNFGSALKKPSLEYPV